MQRRDQSGGKVVGLDCWLCGLLTAESTRKKESPFCYYALAMVLMQSLNHSGGYLLALWTAWTPYFSLWEEEGSAPKKLCRKKLKALTGFWHMSCTGTF